MPRSIEFVENRDPQGCFEADAEGLTRIDQGEVRRALDKAELYMVTGELSLAMAEVINSAMAEAGLPLKLKEELPYFDGFYGDEIALDESSDVVEDRLATLQKSLAEDDHQGLIIYYPCTRPGSSFVFGHFVAAIEGQEPGAALTVMDPSELRDDRGERIGGVFQRNEDEALDMLTPNSDLMIPVIAYSVRTDSSRQIMHEAEAGASLQADAELPEVDAWSKTPILI